MDIPSSIRGPPLVSEPEGIHWTGPKPVTHENQGGIARLRPEVFGEPEESSAAWPSFRESQVQEHTREGALTGPLPITALLRSCPSQTFGKRVSHCPTEAPVGIEPTNSRFAVCRLTTWPRRRTTL